MYVEGIESLKVKNLKGLSKKKSFDLFLKKIHSDEDRKKIFDRENLEELHNFTTDDPTVKVKNLCKVKCMLQKHKDNTDACAIAYLE